jgi:hypothetical protein
VSGSANIFAFIYWSGVFLRSLMRLYNEPPISLPQSNTLPSFEEKEGKFEEGRNDQKNPDALAGTFS